MFNHTKKYYYGEGTENIIKLTEAEANAANNIRIIDIVENENGTFVKTNLNEEEMRAYSSAAEKLNEYLETHTVFAPEEFLEKNDILRPVK